MFQKYFQIYWASSSATQNGKSGFKKKAILKKTILHFFFNPLQHEKRCQMTFFGYFNALKTHGEGPFVSHDILFVQ
jgi:hypothetical protein